MKDISKTLTQEQIDAYINQARADRGNIFDLELHKVLLIEGAKSEIFKRVITSGVTDCLLNMVENNNPLAMESAIAAKIIGGMVLGFKLAQSLAEKEFLEETIK